MNLINIASTKLGARILQVSSTQDQIIYSPTNILSENQDRLWTSQDGLPQYIIIGLHEVPQNYQNITSIGIFSTHDYQTNPKVIELWVSNTFNPEEEEKFIHWEDIGLLKKKGMQIFDIDPIPESYRFIKLIITETYGEYQTYLNQVMLLAQPPVQSGESLLNNEQWEQIRKEAHMRRQKPTSSPPYIQNIKPEDKSEDLDLLLHQNQSPIERVQESLHKKRGKRVLQYEELEQTDNQKLFPAFNEYKKKNLKGSFKASSRCSRQLQELKQSSDYMKNIKMLKITKNMMMLEDNMEDLSRKINVLEIKVDTAYGTFQKNILDKVEEIVGREITKQISEKNLFPRKNSDIFDDNEKLHRIKSNSNKLGTSRSTKKIGLQHQRPVKQSQKLYSASEYKLQEPQKKQNNKIQELCRQLQKKLNEKEKKMKKLQQKQSRTQRPQKYDKFAHHEYYHD